MDGDGEGAAGQSHRRRPLHLHPAAQCGALAGATQRAVYFGNDRENIFRFVRDHQDVTIVKGSSDYCNAAADRLAEILKPWGVRCTIVNAADVNKPRALSAEESRTWVGLDFGRVDAKNVTPGLPGFAVQGPVHPARHAGG